MNKLIEFAKNNTMIVAGVAAVVLFIAMNSLTSCVAHSNGDGSSQQQEQSASEIQSGKKSKTRKVNLTDEQKSVIGNYSNETKSVIETLENIKWAAVDDAGALDIKDGVFTETHSDTDSSSSKPVVKKTVNTFAITASDQLNIDQTGAVSYKLFTIVDGKGKDHILKLSTVNPAANGEGGDTYYQLTCDLFKNANGYTNNRSAENVTISALDDPNLSKAIDGRTKALKQSLIEYLLANHATATELIWDGDVTFMYSSNAVSFSFGIQTTRVSESDSIPRVNVTYHTDTHEFEEAEIQ